MDRVLTLYVCTRNHSGKRNRENVVAVTVALVCVRTVAPFDVGGGCCVGCRRRCSRDGVGDRLCWGESACDPHLLVAAANCQRRLVSTSDK
jgi:hypothetical protein